MVRHRDTAHDRRDCSWSCALLLRRCRGSEEPPTVRVRHGPHPVAPGTPEHGYPKKTSASEKSFVRNQLELGRGLGERYEIDRRAVEEPPCPGRLRPGAGRPRRAGRTGWRGPGRTPSGCPRAVHARARWPGPPCPSAGRSPPPAGCRYRSTACGRRHRPPRPRAGNVPSAERVPSATTTMGHVVTGEPVLDELAHPVDVEGSLRDQNQRWRRRPSRRGRQSIPAWRPITRLSPPVVVLRRCGGGRWPRWRSSPRYRTRTCSRLPRDRCRWSSAPQ